MEAGHNGSTDATFPSRILIVEDDRGLMPLLEKAFQNHSDVIRAWNGREGLEQIFHRGPDFVVTDLMMPEMDGLEMIRQARRSPLAACLPILVLTARTEEQTLIEAFRSGADDFMHKPFSIAELRVRVQTIYLRQAVARDSNPLTKLPGNLVLKREIDVRMKQDAQMAVAYIDLDHFKEFNDSRGFDRGDHVIQLVADILRTYSLTYPPGEIFVGHIGGDDYVAILPLDKVDHLCEFIFREFDAAVSPLFTPDEVAKGSYRAHGRSGQEYDVPLLSMSVGVVSNQRRDMNDHRKIAQVAAEVKSMAKRARGNSLFIDRRTA